MSFWMLEGKHHPLTPIIPLKKLKEGVEAGSFEQLVSKSWEMFHFITLSLPLMLELFATTESNRILSGSMCIQKIWNSYIQKDKNTDWGKCKPSKRLLDFECDKLVITHFA